MQDTKKYIKELIVQYPNCARALTSLLDQFKFVYKFNVQIQAMVDKINPDYDNELNIARYIGCLVGYLESIKFSNKCLMEKYQRVILELPDIELNMKEKIDSITEDTRKIVLSFLPLLKNFLNTIISNDKTNSPKIDLSQLDEDIEFFKNHYSNERIQNLVQFSDKICDDIFKTSSITRRS